ncbi:hypothetical protein N9733_08195, partial [Akkermansiaceae bacterium]|nr:hypothetical protein [Akkermansiaceae bacterium]
MQKSGLIDTMWDLIVDCIGAIIGSSAGFLYLEKRHGTGLLAGWIRSFIRLNKKLYSKSEEKS